MKFGGLKLISKFANRAQAFELGAFLIFSLHFAIAFFLAIWIVCEVHVDQMCVGSSVEFVCLHVRSMCIFCR